MSFTSWPFLALVLGAVVVYYVVPGKARWIVLLAASYAFYLSGGVRTVGYLLSTTLSTYLAGRALGALNEVRTALPQTEKAARERLARWKKWTVLVTALANFGLLYALKYWQTTAAQLHTLLGWELPAPELVLPLGISFYMFQSVGYVVDCYRGKCPPERNIARYALFTSFFPQLVQGPISRFGQLAPQLTARRRFDAAPVKYGIQLMMWGYLKKLVISDRAGVIVAAVFGDYLQYHGTLLAAGVLFYCIQLYCDFSGGIDIARGAAQMFGIDLAENFRRPFFATSLADYWRRWHITLGQWMRDYVFYPLALSKPFARLGRWTRRRIGGKLGKLLPTSAATFIVYLLIGISHGTSFRYIAFGLWNGAVITASLLLEGRFQAARERLGIRPESRGWRLFQIVRTWGLVFLGRYLTRAGSFRAALWMIGMTVADPEVAALWDGRMLALGLPAADIAVIFAGMAVILLVEGYQERGGHVRAALERRHWLVQWAAILAPLAAIVLLGVMRGDYVPAQFIYQQF